MGKYGKLLFQILRATSDTNIGFDDLRQLLLRLGFEERIRGSHHSFGKRESRKRSISSETMARPRLTRCGG